MICSIEVLEDDMRNPWEEPLELIAHLVQTLLLGLKVIAPFICGVKEVVYDANLFHSTLGLHKGGSMSTRSLKKKNVQISGGNILGHLKRREGQSPHSCLQQPGGETANLTLAQAHIWI